MRILVAGWHGQVSLAISEAAARRDDVTAYAVGRPALDLTDRPAIGRGLFGLAPDVIINTAAYTDVEGAEREPVAAFQRNSAGAEALASLAAKLEIPVIHLSTVYVFDGSKQMPYTESDATNPINTYGRSKRAGEIAVAAANPRHIIARTGWIYSSFGRNFVTSILARKNGSPNMSVDSSQHGSPTYAPHLAHALLDIAAEITSAKHATEVPWGTYHIADGGTATWHDIAAETLRIAGAGAHLTTSTASSAPATAIAAARPLNARLDCSKLQSNFGITLPNWRAALADCVTRATEQP